MFSNYNKIISFVLLYCCYTCSIAQNLIPNPSFESVSALPLKWNTSGGDFDPILYDWSSPTYASPDAYGEEIAVPEYWRKQGFGYVIPPNGRGFVGLTLYGCNGGKPHCREYIQVKLTEKLVPGQNYQLSFYTTPLPKGLRINNIGVAFTYDFFNKNIDQVLKIPVTSYVKKIIEPNPGKWVMVKLLFQAKSRGQYMILGNFFEDEDTKASKDIVYSKLKFAYYYFDQFKLEKIPPIIEYTDTSNIYLERSYEINESVILKNIYFDYDTDSLLAESYLTLAHFLELLTEYPDLKIELNGHTDSDGSDDYNYKLSIRRVKRVYDYLVENGIDKYRLSYKGFGESIPIAKNSTEVGKSMNRRVVFIVLSQ